MKKTTNYDQFSFLLGNRNLNPGHVKKLVASISQQNLLQFNPIMVTKDLLVIDGQHRLEAAKELQVPIFYNVVHGKLNTVLLLNNNAKNWSVSDFVESFIELGYEDYSVLKEFSQEWGIGYTLAANLLMGSKVYTDGAKASVIKSGDFIVTTLDEAKETMMWIDAFSQYSDSLIRGNRYFVSAVTRLKDAGVITLSGLKHKLEISGKQLTRMNSVVDYMRQLEEIINYKSRRNLRIY